MDRLLSLGEILEQVELIKKSIKHDRITNEDRLDIAYSLNNELIDCLEILTDKTEAAEDAQDARDRARGIEPPKRERGMDKFFTTLNCDKEVEDETFEDYDDADDGVDVHLFLRTGK